MIDEFLPDLDAPSNSIERIREGLRPGDVEEAIITIVDDELANVTGITQRVLDGEVRTF